LSFTKNASYAKEVVSGGKATCSELDAIQHVFYTMSLESIILYEHVMENGAE